MKYLYAVTQQGSVSEEARGTWAEINRARKEVWDRNRTLDAKARVMTTVYDDGGFRCSP